MILNLDILIAPYFDKYPNEWLLFEVTDTDEHDWPGEYVNCIYQC